MADRPMKIRPNAHKDVLRKLWHPATVRKLGRELADIAANSLLVEDGPVRKPGASQFAAKIVRGRARNTNLADLVREIQKASLQLSHPRYIAQQVAAPIPAAALVESVVAAMNQSLAAWEMSPIATAIDRDLIGRFKRLLGYSQKAEGSLVPGGAFSNLTALLAAREWLEPGTSRRGGARIALIAGAQSHYSVARSAAILGVGTDAVFRVPLNPGFATDIARVPEAFAAGRKAGFRKFILIGSSGSTPTGSFDDLVALRKIAIQHRAWFHVDAAHGGGIAFSRRFRKRLQGLGMADSITFDPHKMMFMPLSAGGVLVRDGARLTQPLQEHAPYLFGPPRQWPDIGQVTIACSQRFDALKVWLLWRAYGPQLWDVLTTHACEVTQAAFQYCAQSDVLQAAHQPHSNILCFHLRHGSGSKADGQIWAIKEELNESGFGYLSSTVLDGRRVLRLVVMNPRTTVADVHDLLSRVERTAKGRRVARGTNSRS